MALTISGLFFANDPTVWAVSNVDDDLIKWPATDGLSMTPKPDRLASAGSIDTGAEQIRERRGELLDFSWRTVPLTRYEDAAVQHWIDTFGGGGLNFAFYLPYSRYFTNLLLGLTDGSSTLTVPFNELASFSNLLVDGSPVTYGWTPAAGTYLEDIFGWLDTDPPAGQEVTVDDAYTRFRYICRVTSYRRSVFAGGKSTPEDFVGSWPLWRSIWEIAFTERGPREF